MIKVNIKYVCDMVLMVTKKIVLKRKVFMKNHIIITVILGFMTSVLSAQSHLIGKKAPLFSAQAVFANGSVGTFNLKDYIGQKIVLYFYPMDSTPGCSKQAQSFCTNLGLLQDEHIVLVGISCDSINSHKNFQKKYGISYPLVSDSRWKQTISKLYGAAGFLYSKRKTILINKAGIVFKVFDHVDIHSQIDDIVHSFAQQD